MTRALLLCLLAVAVAGCDHTTVPDGPNLVDRFGPFTLVEPLGADRQSVDFAAGEAVTFSARFNKQTDWVLEIVGQESGAVRRIEGFSNELTAENARWTGRTTELPLFRDEPVEARLFFPSEAGSDTSRAAVEVVSAREYPGRVLADFEVGSGAAVTLGNFEFDFDLSRTGIQTDDPPAAQGDRYYRLFGTDRTLDNFFVGLVQFSPPGNRGFVPVPTTVPEDLFFNAFVFGRGDAGTIAILEVAVDANGNGRFNDGDTLFGSGEIRFDEEGWTLFSRSAADLGLSDAQTSQIVAVRAVLISDNNVQPTPRRPVEFGVDYITFTGGGPLEL